MVFAEGEAVVALIQIRLESWVQVIGIFLAALILHFLRDVLHMPVSLAQHLRVSFVNRLAVSGSVALVDGWNRPIFGHFQLQLCALLGLESQSLCLALL